MMLLHLHMLLRLHMEVGNWSKVGCIVKEYQDSVSSFHVNGRLWPGLDPDTCASLRLWHKHAFVKL